MSWFTVLLTSGLVLFSFLPSVQAQEELEIEPKIIKESPTLQRWLKEIPNVLEDIDNDPSFKSRLRVGYLEFPSQHDKSGIAVGVDDLFIGKTNLTVTGEYQTAFQGNLSTAGVNFQYYVLPLGYIVNIAPVVGYRSVTTEQYSTDGVNVGARLKLILSRTSAADISLTQTFINPGGNEEVGVTVLSTGYAITPTLRLSAEVQKQNSRINKESHVGLFLEWMFP